MNNLQEKTEIPYDICEGQTILHLRCLIRRRTFLQSTHICIAIAFFKFQLEYIMKKNSIVKTTI